MTIFTRARALLRVCVCVNISPTNIFDMEEIISIFDKFGFAVALSITLLIVGYRLVKQQIKYLQDTIMELAKIIAANTEIYKKLYDYLTKT